MSLLQYFYIIALLITSNKRDSSTVQYYISVNTHNEKDKGLLDRQSYGTPDRLTSLWIFKIHGEDHNMPVCAETDEVVLEGVDQEDGEWHFSICTESVIQLCVTRIKSDLIFSQKNQYQ